MNLKPLSHLEHKVTETFVRHQFRVFRRYDIMTSQVADDKSQIHDPLPPLKDF